MLYQETFSIFLRLQLILQLTPAVDKEALVSREKVTEFKKWMGK